MTSRCYYCSANEHHECHSESCTCCGERNVERQRKVNELEAAIRESLQRRNQ
jgi:hypothetical protein